MMSELNCSSSPKRIHSRFQQSLRTNWLQFDCNCYWTVCSLWKIFSTIPPDMLVFLLRTGICGDKWTVWILRKASGITHNRLVAGSNPAGPTNIISNPPASANFLFPNQTLDLLQKYWMCHNRHMRYETVKELKDAEFRRSTGVSREMFEKMLVVLQKGIRDFGYCPSSSLMR